jgi:hypothetical protein
LPEYELESRPDLGQQPSWKLHLLSHEYGFTGLDVHQFFGPAKWQFKRGDIHLVDPVKSQSKN